MPIIIEIDVMLARRKMSVRELAERVGITPANLAVLKNGRAKAVRFTTLDALCTALDCQPGALRPELGERGHRSHCAEKHERCRERRERSAIVSEIRHRRSVTPGVREKQERLARRPVPTSKKMGSPFRPPSGAVASQGNPRPRL